MTFSLPFLRERFEKFNRQIFAGRLPEATLTLCEATSFVGQYKSKIRPLPDGRKERYDHQMRFSVAFNLPERELEDTLIHEMIHYFIAFNGLEDRSPHGPIFKALMNSINENHRRSLSITRRMTHEEIAEAKNVKKKWHVIAILHLASGEKGVKVLPRVIPKIIDYQRQACAARNIKGLDLYLHNDPFFNRYPTSVGRRIHLISDEEISLHLSGAHRLSVKDGKLIQH